MTTEKDYLKKSTNKELAKTVLAQLSLDFKEIVSRPYDFRDARVGVSGFIYYNETTQFAKENLWLITKALNEFEAETGQPLQKPIEDETQYLNWLAWFALESVIDEIIQLKEL